MAKRRRYLGPTSVINCTPLSALSFRVSLFPKMRGYTTIVRDRRDAGSIPGSGRSPGEEHGNPLKYFCQENSMDRGAWQATVHRVTQSCTQLKQVSIHAGSKEGQRRRGKDNEPFRSLSFRDRSEGGLHLLKSSLQLRWIVSKNGWNFPCPARSLLAATSSSPGKWRCLKTLQCSEMENYYSDILSS